MQCCLVWNNTCIYIYLYICHVYKMKACYWFVTLNLYYINQTDILIGIVYLHYTKWEYLTNYTPLLFRYLLIPEKKIHKNLCEANTSLYRSKQGQGWYTGLCCRGLQIEVTALGVCNTLSKNDKYPKKYIVVTNKSLQVDQYLKRRVVKALTRERFPIVMKMSSFAFVKQLHCL